MKICVACWLASLTIIGCARGDPLGDLGLCLVYISNPPTHTQPSLLPWVLGLVCIALQLTALAHRTLH